MNLNSNLIILKNKHTLQYNEFLFRCSIGKKGLSFNKTEGDYKTPKGIYALGNIYYRQDRVQKPETKILCKKIFPKMGWGNDIKNKKNYNKLINLKKNTKAEKLFRKDYKYNFILPILYNTKKRIIGKGSAIFIHLTKNYEGTAGCIALKKKDFLILIKLINKKTKIKIS